MTPAKRSWSYDDYSVGWICALPKEQTAATAMLDERHPDLPKPTNDTNTYTLGSIGSHNVVIACLPKGQYGIVSAANVAALMIRSFSCIRIGLMVGIGGGVPPKVRLGDVVVSTPGGQFPGVVQWDLGKEIDGGKFERTGTLSNPPSSLLTALAKLETEHELTGSKIPTFLEELKGKYPRLAKKYLKSDSLQDVLFRADYRHVNEPFMNTEGPTGGAAELLQQEDEEGSEEYDEEPCPFCDKNKILQKKRRSMRVHYGLIASGNKVIKNGLHRDELNVALGGNVLCFEMEAAGLMNNFPCLVIRGICDYCDSHKNKHWQEHAAAVAAAFAKELLGCIQPGAVEGEQLIRDVICEEVKKDIKNFYDIKRQLEDLHDDRETKKQEETLNWLSSHDFDLLQHDYFKRCEPDTGQEFINSGEVQNWILTSKQTLFSQGIPGAGKTFQMAILVNYLVERFQWDGTIGIAYLYYNFKRHHEQTPEQMLASLVKQLAQNSKLFPEVLHQLRDRHSLKKTNPFLSELSKAFMALVQSFSRVYILVDALDEGDDGGRATFLREIFTVQENTGLNLFATSRAINSIAASFKGSISRDISPTSHDIFQFLNARMSKLPSFVADDEELQNEIKASVQSAIGGMFLLAELYIGSLAGKRSPEAVKVALGDLNQASSSSDKSIVLNQAYDKSMERIQQLPGDMSTDGILILSWIVKAKRQLKLIELQEALAVEIGASRLNTNNIPTVEHITQSCASLVIVEGDTVKLVHYTAQEYFEHPDNKWMQKAHEKIANICMAYLSFSSFRYGHYSSQEGINRRIQENPLYTYSVEHWVYHVNEASTHGFESSTVINFLGYGKTRWAWYQDLLYGHSQESSSLKFIPERLTELHVAAFFGLYDVTAKLLEQGHSPDAKDSFLRVPIWWAAWNGHIRVVQLLLEVSTDLEAKDLDYCSTPLLIAARRGHTMVVEKLLDKCGIESKDYCGWTSLNAAAQLGNKGVFELLVEKGADIEARDNDCRTPLAIAAMEGRSTAVSWLLDNRADIESKDAKNRTPLMLATLKNHEDLVRYLIEKGADMKVMDYDKQTALSIAIQESFLNILEIFFQKGIDINANMSNHYTPLTLAIEKTKFTVAKWLIEQGANVDTKDGYGMTPLLSAIEKELQEFVELLVDKGADLEIRRNVHLTGPTPLILATIKKQLQIVDFLIEKGAKLEKTYWYRTALSTAAKRGYTDIIQLLIEKGANIEAGEGGSGTPLSIAARYWNPGCIQLLLANKANTEARDFSGETPLSNAAWSGDPGCVQLLLANGANIETRNNHGDTPLGNAALKGKAECIQLLLARKADIEARNNSGRTPLSNAAWSGKPECIQLLLAQKANIETRDNDGDTPLMVAVERQQLRCIQLLLDGNADIEAKDHSGVTSLVRTIRNDDTRAAKILLQNNANTRYRSASGRTLMHMAVNSRNLESVNMLLACEAVSVDERDNNGRTPLSHAAVQPNNAMVKALLDSGRVDANAKDHQGYTPLLYAIHDKYESIVKILLDSGKVDNGVKDNKGRTPLLYAIERRDLLILQVLLDSRNIDVNKKDDRGRTPLHIMVERKNLPIIRMLLDCEKTDVDAKDNYGRTPLLYAIDLGDISIVETLLNCGKTDINADDNEGRTPLRYAVKRKNSRIMKLLLDCEKVDVDAKDNRGRTPLFYAIEIRHLSIVKPSLESRKAGIEARDKKRCLPLRYAIEGRDKSIIRALLDTRKVDINATDVQGFTPLLYAIKCEESSLVDLLFDMANMNVNTRDKRGRTPLSRAMGLGDTSIVKALLNFNETDAEARDNMGRTPLSYATSCDVARVLIKMRRVDVNSIDNLGRSPLWYAAQAGNHQLIELLVRRGAYDSSKARGVRRRAVHGVRFVVVTFGGLSLWQNIRASPVVTVFPSIVYNYFTWSPLR